MSDPDGPEDCKCAAEEAPVVCYNPPGQENLKYRLGTYGSFFHQMVKRAPNISVSTPAGDRIYPLENFNTKSRDHLGTALLSAWAAVADVMTFYQERVANEGYVTTAVEDFSVVKLAEHLGRAPSPGIASQTYLAFTLFSGKTAPKKLTLPEGPNTAAYSIPQQGAAPIVFETGEEIEARPEWNAISPYIEIQPVLQELRTGDTLIRLAGTTTGLKPGSPLLFVLSKRTAGKDSGPAYFFRLVDQVFPDAGDGFTLVTWDGGLPPFKEDSHTDFKILTFGTNAPLFGGGAPAWKGLPVNLQAGYGTRKGGVYLWEEDPESQTDSTGDSGCWVSGNGDNQSTGASQPEILPSNDIRALAATKDGNLFAGTAAGVYRTPDGGATWELCEAGMTRLDVHSVYLADDSSGSLFAGTVGGGVFRSTDGGDSWDSLPREYKKVPAPISPIPSSSSGPSSSSALSSSSVLPSSSSSSGNSDIQLAPRTVLTSVVRSIITHPSTSSSTDQSGAPSFVFVGTDNGVFRLREGETNWESYNQKFPSLSAKTGLATITINALACHENVLYAGTNLGLFWRDLSNANWKNVDSTKLPDVQALLVVDANLFVGTAGGIFRFVIISSGEPKFFDRKRDRKRDRLSIRSLALAGNKEPDSIFAGTDDGIYWTDDKGENWKPAGRQKIDLFHAAGLFAAQLDQRILTEPIPAIFARNGHALGENAKVQRIVKGQSWQIDDDITYRIVEVSKNRLEVTKDYPVPDETSVVFQIDIGFKTDLDDLPRTTRELRDVFAKNGQHISVGAKVIIDEYGDKWEIISHRVYPVQLDGDQLQVSTIGDLSNDDIYAIAGGGGLLVAAAPFNGVIETEWPDFHIVHSQIDLSRPVAGVERDSLIALAQETPASLTVAYEPVYNPENLERVMQSDVYPVESTTQMMGSAFSLSGKTTRFTTTDNGRLGLYDLRQATAYCDDEPLEPFVGLKPVFEPVRSSQFTLEGVLDGLRREMNMSVTGTLASAVIPEIGGVFERRGQAPWECSGLAQRDVRALAVVKTGTGEVVYAGTKGNGVFSRDRVESATWKMSSAGLTGEGALDVRALTVKGGTVIAGTGSGVYQLTEGNWTALGGENQTLFDWGYLVSSAHISALAVDGETIYAGNPIGVFSWEEKNGQWTMISSGDVENVSALAVDGAYLYAGTTEGVYRGTLGKNDGDSDWIPINRGLIQIDVRALAVGKETSEIFAGTKGGGVFHLQESPGNDSVTVGRWKPVNDGLLDRDVRALAFDHDKKNLYAGTKGGGVYRLEMVLPDGEMRWVPSLIGAANDIRAVASLEEGSMLAGAADSVLLSLPGRPNKLPVKPAHVTAVNSPIQNDLDHLWISPPLVAALKTAGIVLPESASLTLRKRGIRWLLRNGDDIYVIQTREEEQSAGVSPVEPACFDVYQSELLQVEKQPDYELELIAVSDPLDIPSSGNNVVIAAIAEAPEPGGEIPRDDYFLRIFDADGRKIVDENLKKISNLKNEIQRLRRKDALGALDKSGCGDQLMSLVNPPLLVWYFKTAKGTARLSAIGAKIPIGGEVPPEGEILWQPAASTNSQAADVGVLSDVTIDRMQEVTTCRLESQLQHAYDPFQTVFCANVAFATQGETVPREVLGSGDAAVPNQRFTLKGSPLTYLPTSSSTNVSGEIEVRVDEGAYGSQRYRAGHPDSSKTGVPWRETPLLLTSGSSGQHYLLVPNGKGQTEVVFGDGVHGARLPTGQENVAASYRTGGGENGNIPANRVKVLKKGPAGIRSVTNPVPAAEGSASASLSEARRQAPFSVRILDRIVSRGDYEKFAIGYPGIGKAQAVLAPNNRYLILTAGTTGGESINHDLPTKQALAAKIEQCSLGGPRIHVAGFERVFFNLKAALTVSAGEDPETVLEAVRESLIASFSFEKRAFAQDVTGSEVTMAIQQVKGVVSVELEALYKFGHSANRETIAARGAGWDKKSGYRQAQLLLINQEKRGIILTPFADE